MTVKLLIAVLWDENAERAVPELVARGFRVTRVASTGGFLRRGNTTLLLGVEDARVDEAVGVLKASGSEVELPGSGRGAIFVLDVDRYEHV